MLNKIMGSITFKKLIFYWVIMVILFNLLNDFTIRSSFLNCLIFASIGIFLLFYPVYTFEMKQKYGIEKSKKYIRIIAVVEIILFFY